MPKLQSDVKPTSDCINKALPCRSCIYSLDGIGQRGYCKKVDMDEVNKNREEVIIQKDKQDESVKEEPTKKVAKKPKRGRKKKKA